MASEKQAPHAASDAIADAPHLSPVPSNVLAEKESIGDDEHTDVGLGLYREALLMDPAHRERVARKVLLKLDFILLPVMCAVYLMGFLDKQTLNYANAYNLQSDLGLHGRQYSWVAAILNFGFVFGSYPSSLAIQKIHLGRLVSCMVILWGALLMACAGAKSFAGIMALRFLLGMFESTISPAWVIMTSMFWKRHEQPLRFCFWLGCNGIAQLIGAGISWGLGHTDSTSLAPWQLIFLVIGALTSALGLACVFILPAGPQDAPFLSPEERVVAVWRVRENQTGIKHPKWLWYQVREAAREPRVWLVFLQNLSIGVVNGGVANFFSALLKGFGWSANQAVLYQLPNGAFQFTCTVAAGFVASRFKNITSITTMVVVLPSLAGLIGIATIDRRHIMALTACNWLLSVAGAAIILNWSLAGANYAGHSKRTVVNAVTFIGYYGGNIVGPFVFIPSEAPRYLTALKTLCGMFALNLVATGGAALLMWRENKRRDAAAAAATHQTVDEVDAAVAGFSDLTDGENKSFRYRF